uniref:Uncharacterized protein n=1 Tax=Coccidioides posadasii RMSCC 3488 TaxID=454284 RepID=A0A0J6ETG8_COCPO|nr:hypothetical protein CPAG_00155 [Coccidioides posadasii RMSCC 3488]
MLTPLKIILELRLKASETRAKQAVAFGLPAKDPGPLFHWRINSLREDYPKQDGVRARQDRVQLSTTTIVNRMVCGKGSADGETGRGRSVVVPFKLTTDRIWQLSPHIICLRPDFHANFIFAAYAVEKARSRYRGDLCTQLVG